MWTHSMEPQVELPGEHEMCERCAEKGAGTLWTHPLEPSVEPPGGHETCEGCARMGAGAPSGRTRLGHTWSSLGGAKRVRGVPEYARGCHVGAPAGAIHCGAWIRNI